MEYLIAGIRIDIPHRFTTGAFGMALAPFAAENKTETDAGSNRMAGPVPGTATTAAPSPSETPGTERSAPHPATSPADTAQPDLILHTGLLAGDTAGYCELDAFDFTDADADCRFGRDTEGYLLTMTPRDGSAPARFHKAFGSPDATSDITPEHNPALFRFGLWTMFNIAALERRAVAVHSSVISLDGRAVLFLGESGTGKSTHTRLWREHIPGAPADPVPETRAADGNASTARQTRLSGDTPGTAPDLHTPACGTRHPAPPPSGIGALRTGDVVLFRCEGRHILHRIVGIETGVRCEGNRPVCAPAAGNAPSPAASAENPAERDSAAGTLRFTLSGDGNYRTTEHCLGKDIVAVMTAVILPSGRIVRTSSRRWKRRSRRWLALPRGVRRFVLRVMWRLGIR